jgi:hypothetical protein
MIKETSGWAGIFKVSINGGEEEMIKNRITNAALNELMKILQGQAANMEIKFLALGTSANPIVDTDTKLGNEIHRVQFDTKEITATGQLTSIASAEAGEAVGIIEEIGIFGGPGATDAPNSGMLISRVLWHREKTSLEEIQFTRIDTITRG